MITLLRNYSTYLSGASIVLDSDTEAALVAQGYATAVTNGPVGVSRIGSPGMAVTTGGVVSSEPQSGITTTIGTNQGPVTWPCIPLGSNALTGYETNGVAQTAGTMNLCEIYVPFTQAWTGLGILNGTTVGTHNVLCALYGSNGVLLANSAVAGAVSAGASAMQNIAFTAPIVLPPGSYLAGFQFSGTTPTPRHLLSANGATNRTGTQAGVFGTVPATITTVPTTFTTAVGPICQLYV